jgi:hypothetical protein
MTTDPVSDPEVPTLADAARDALAAIDRGELRGHPVDGVDGHRAVTRLRAALGQREPARQMIDEVTAEHASTWEPHGRGFAVDGTSLAGQREPDTPASVSAANKATPYGEWSQLYDSFGVCPHDVFRTEPCGECPPRSHPCDRVPAIPEGGELDDLLRRADYWGQQVPRIGPTTADVFDVMARLASALRSQREQLTDERRRVEAFRTAANVSHASVVKLERELAEVRDTPRGDGFYGRRDLEEAYFYAAAGGRSTETAATPGQRSALPGVDELADILSRHSSLTLWREKAEAVLADISAGGERDTRGEVLAETRTVIPAITDDPSDRSYQSELHIGLDVPFSTKVVVVRAAEDKETPT